MKVQAINSCYNYKFQRINKRQNVSFGSLNLPQQGWTKLSDVNDYRCLDNVWAVPPMIILGLLHRGDLNIYSENSKPIIAYTTQKDGGIHCLFGNGAYHPYVWTFFKPEGFENINSLLNDDNSYTVVGCCDQLVDGVKLSRDNRCSICQKSVFFPLEWGDRDVNIPSRYLEIMKKHLEENK